MGDEYKVHDLRTLYANVAALAEIEKMPVPRRHDTYKKAKARVIKRVAKKLGNTPRVASDSYINPLVFASWAGSAPPNEAVIAA